MYKSWSEKEKPGIQRLRQEASNANGETVRLLSTDPDNNIYIRYCHGALEAVFLAKLAFLDDQTIEFRVYRSTLRREDLTNPLHKREAEKIWSTIQVALEEWPANWDEPDLSHKNTVKFI